MTRFEETRMGPFSSDIDLRRSRRARQPVGGGTGRGHRAGHDRRRLDALEARLGVKLLQRTTRKLALTDEGAAFLEDCQRILAELEEAEAAVSERSARMPPVTCWCRRRPASGASTWRRCVPSFLAEHRDVTST
jgi:hypothetical protein